MKQTDVQAAAWTKSFESGKFVRKSSEFRDQIETGGTFDVESDRYHLYISHACPWAHRTLITRALLGLEDHITVDVVDWHMNRDGSWSFNSEIEGATADTINGQNSLEGVYNRAFDGWKESQRIGTVPVLWDKKHATIVNNESSEIIRMLDILAQSGLGNGTTLCPPELKDEIDAMIAANYESVNNGVYKSGFARTQSAYDEAVTGLFNRLDELETHLEGRDWLVGAEKGQLTEADICLFPTLVRFDLVYVVHFKCNLRRIIDYPNLQAFIERMLNQPGLRDTCHWDHIKGHYFWSHQSINTYRIIPLGPLEGAHTK
ncbi:MAG TPA: glutathione S-transferase family protein [Candidatus Poseidoniales archaeon]|jgi:putative glutathione S-transferase|nr:MAG: glutathione-dependent reductase [Euryarchaeota archaeon]HIF45746.1 glutathione S-transferase family protein [Candidatus Poseidoniales archaeon]HIL65822.1 glutathione S-transferase family protein [Candidatus Poseidoniales archaeon]